MAKSGGTGTSGYYAAKNKNDLVFALGDIFAKIQATNSTFASASLPVSATNRAVNANEVYIGMFRPDEAAKPLWYGNLKRYKIGSFGGSFNLADKSGGQAVNPVTGFLDNCATSWWTSDSGKYWSGVTSNPPPIGTCPASPKNPFDPYSDAPDGPLVEKGSVGEIIRQGNRFCQRTQRRRKRNVSDLSVRSGGRNENYAYPSDRPRRRRAFKAHADKLWIPDGDLLRRKRWHATLRRLRDRHGALGVRRGGILPDASALASGQSAHQL
jgi:hypothetical protein